MTHSLRAIIGIVITIGLIVAARNTLVHGGIVKRTVLLMGTVVEIDVPIKSEADRAATQVLADRAIDEVRRIEDLFSVYKPGSEVSLINTLKAGQPLKLSQESFYLIEQSLEFSAKTLGAFDITIKPLVDLWSRAGKTQSLPSEQDVRDALDKVGAKNVVLNKADRTIVFRRDGMGIDLGAIAKGYAADRAAAILRQGGIRSAIVNCGGHIYCIGKRLSGHSWMVGIRNPIDKGKTLLQLPLHDEAIDTSGDYERFFMLDGKRYPHIIDPRSGYPISNGIVSASVIADNSMTADALATALCVLGKDGLSVLGSYNGVDAMIIQEHAGVFTVIKSAGFKGKHGSEKEIELKL